MLHISEIASKTYEIAQASLTGKVTRSGVSFLVHFPLRI
jgi:hypothetical protein